MTTKLTNLELELQVTLDKIQVQYNNNDMCKNQKVFETEFTVLADKFKEVSDNNQTLGKSYAAVTKTLEQNVIKVQESFEKQTDSLVSRIESRERREKNSELRSRNIVIFGIKECDNKEEWIQQVDNIIKECHVDLSLDKSNIYRLGRYDATKHTERPHPLRLSTKSESQMRDLLSRINGLKMLGIFARKDLIRKNRMRIFGSAKS